MSSRSGIALLVVAGILTLLMLSAAAFSRAVAQGRECSVAAVDRIQSRLLACSGIELAAARLIQDPLPAGARSAGNQSDDWTARDPSDTPLESLRNPSYAMGEPYDDSLTGNGRYDPGVDAYADWNQTGAFESWSGRLRSRQGGVQGVFLLRIVPAGAAVNVNDGVLGPVGHDDPDFGPPGDYSGAYADFPMPLRDVYIWQPNRNLSLFLDALSEAAGLPPGSGVGERIVRSRPAGGYASTAPLLEVLLPRERQVLGRFLRAGRDRKPVGLHPVFDDPSAPWWRYEPDWRSPVDLRDAPEELLEALWRDLEGVKPWGDAVSIRISRPEAVRLAHFLAGARRTAPFLGREDLYRRINDARHGLFNLLPEARYSGGLVLGHLPETDFTADKVDLVDANAHPEPVRQIDGTLGGYSFDAERDILAVDRRAPRGDHLNRYRGGFQLRNGKTTEVSLDPPDAFIVESLGNAGKAARCRVRAELQVSGGAAVGSQADFENLQGHRVLPDGVCVEGRPSRDRIQSAPDWPMDEARDLSAHPVYGYSPHLGELRLMTVAAGYVAPGMDEPRLALYLPVWEASQPLRPRRSGESWRSSFSAWARRRGQSPEWVPAESEEFVWMGNHAFPMPSPLEDRVCDRPWADFNSSSQYSGKACPGLWPARTFQWRDAEGRNLNAGQDFPLLDGQGEVHHASILFWVQRACACEQYNPMLASFGGAADLQGGYGPAWSQRSQGAAPTYSPTYQISSPVSLRPWVWFHAAFTILERQVSAYLNGIPIGVDLYEPNPLNTLQAVDWTLSIGGVCEMRIYDEALLPAQILPHAQYRYWTPGTAATLGVGTGSSPDLSRPPEFWSSLYRFPAPTRLQGSRCEAYVPKPIRDATAAYNDLESEEAARKVPLAVDVYAYADPEGRRLLAGSVPNPVRVDGSGAWNAAFPASRAGSFRFRVRMDAEAAATAGEQVNDTPILDSITVEYHLDGKRRDWRED